MPDDNLGSGIKLTEDWDMDIDPTGDISTVSGRKELQKDLAMLLAIRQNEVLGNIMQRQADPNSLKQIELLAKRTIQSDERVRSVNNVSVQPHPSEPDAAMVEADVTADSDQNYGLVIEVSE